MTVLTDREEIIKIRECGKYLKQIFLQLERRIKAGISTLQLDKEAENLIRSVGAEPAFKGYKGYPAAICASVNEVVVHGIPSDKVILSEGDIVAIDVGIRKNGYFTDAAKTFAIGEIDNEATRLVKVTKRSLEEAIKQAVAGNHLYDISNVIESIAKQEGFEEVRMFVGHGIGTKLHESPEVPNWGEKGKGPVLEEGLVLAIEPMINAGTRNVRILPDKWTAVTQDGRLSAHFEDTIIVGRKKAEILT